MTGQASNIAICLFFLSSGLCPTASQAASENSTFYPSNFALFYLVRPPSENSTVLSQLDLRFRTSHGNQSHLFSLANNNNETLTVELRNSEQLRLRLSWLDSDAFGESLTLALDASTMNIIRQIHLDLPAPGVGNGSWHSVRLITKNNGSFELDGIQILDQLLNNFTSGFDWGNSTRIQVGGSSFRGCLAEAVLDQTAFLPLHSQSELLNTTQHLRLDPISKLPLNPGCRQQCPCEPEGACIYRQWDLLDRCNCTRGFEPATLCKTEWNTCEHLDAASLCLNDGVCFNKPGIDNFGCNCTQSRLGSRCQSLDLCQSPLTCQNNALCELIGDVEIPESVDYKCTCATGYSGKNCTELETESNVVLIIGVTVGVLCAVLLAAIVAFIVIKVVRDRRRDTGAYRPSRREVQSKNAGDMAMHAAMRPPIDERLI